METTTVYGDTVGIMEKEKETLLIIGFGDPGFFSDLIGFCMFYLEAHGT